MMVPLSLDHKKIAILHAFSFCPPPSPFPLFPRPFPFLPALASFLASLPLSLFCLIYPLSSPFSLFLPALPLFLSLLSSFSPGSSSLPLPSLSHPSLLHPSLPSSFCHVVSFLKLNHASQIIPSANNSPDSEATHWDSEAHSHGSSLFTGPSEDFHVRASGSRPSIHQALGGLHPMRDPEGESPR